MSFWSKLGRILKSTAKVAAEAVAETAASGKPITLGNLGRAAGAPSAKELGK